MDKQPKKKGRRTVLLSGLSPEMGPTKLWAYGYGDYARLLKTTPEYVRVLVSRGYFNPGDLESLFSYWLARRDEN